MIARAARSLPPGMPSPPSYQKVNPADQPVLFLTLSSATMPLSQVNQYAETVLAQRLSMVSGVAGVNVFGAQKFAVRIDVDPTQLASRQIGIDEVAQAVDRRERQSADRHAVRPAAQLRRADERPADERRGLPADPRRLPQRQPGPAQRSRQRLRRRREPAQRQLVQRHARRIYLGDRAPARHQHGRGRRPHQGAAAGAPGAAAGVARACHPQRPLRLDPRVGRRRQVHAAC